jgi:signal transduction histidine kinase
MLLLIVLLMTVVLSFLIRGVDGYFRNEFFARMETCFSDGGFVSELNDAANLPDAPNRLAKIVSAYAGELGVDGISRAYYIFDAQTAVRLAGNELPDGGLITVSDTLLSAMTESADAPRLVHTGGQAREFLDAAVVVAGGEGDFIVYIKDNLESTRSLSYEIFRLILQSVALGFVVAAAVALLMSRTLLAPIRGMTRAAEEMAKGDFSRKIDVESSDEIGTLSVTFNNMASQLETNLEELRGAEQMRRDFVANVSHELRTPLTSVRAYAETIAEAEDMDAETRAEFLGVILHESDRMTKIVTDLLELSRFDADRVAFAPSRFSLEDSVTGVYRAITLEAKRRAQELTIDLPDGLPEIVADRARIEQVLMNIMTNAVKYTPDGGKINVTGGERGNTAWVRISDTGFGIPESDLPRVFDRFYRVDKARSRESGGTGLGLSIAKEIITRHGGVISVESKPGEGSAFTVELPVEGVFRDDG